MKRHDFLKVTTGSAVGAMAFDGLLDAWVGAAAEKSAHCKQDKPTNR